MQSTFNLWAYGIRDATIKFITGALLKLPVVLASVFVLIAGFLVAWLSAVITRKLLRLIRLDPLVADTPLSQVLNAMGYRKGVSELISRLVYWGVLLVFIATSADVIGLRTVSAVIHAIFSYIPNIIAAIVIVIIGLYLARILRDSIVAIFAGAHVPYGVYIAGFAQFVIYIVILVMALDVLGLNTSILLSNINIIIAGLMLSFAISFGIGSKDVLRNMLQIHYLKDVISPGDEVEVDGIKGRIVRITRIGVLIDNGEEEIFVSGERMAKGFRVTSRKE